jgi:hypothetical protein
MSRPSPLLLTSTRLRQAGWQYRKQVPVSCTGSPSGPGAAPPSYKDLLLHPPRAASAAHKPSELQARQDKASQQAAPVWRRRNRLRLRDVSTEVTELSAVRFQPDRLDLHPLQIPRVSHPTLTCGPAHRRPMPPHWRYPLHQRMTYPERSSSLGLHSSSSS